MSQRILYFIAAALALTAACIYVARAEAGDDVTLRAGLLAFLGVGLLLLGLRKGDPPAA